MTENNLAINSKDKKWLSSKEAASIWDCTVNNLVKNAKKFIGELDGEVEGFGRGKVFKITTDGLFILRNIVDGNKWKRPTSSKSLEVELLFMIFLILKKPRNC